MRVDCYVIGRERKWLLAAMARVGTPRAYRALWRVGRTPLGRATPDRWGRCWQAEWTDCRRAVRAWTSRGAERKAMRAMEAGR